MITHHIIQTGRALALAALIGLTGSAAFAQQPTKPKPKSGSSKPAATKPKTPAKAPAKAPAKTQSNSAAPETDNNPKLPENAAKLPADSGWWKKNNCMRKIPQATLKGQNPNIVSSNFKLLYGRAMERAALYSGDTLQIEHGGCDAYVLTYTVKTATAPQPASKKSYWFERAGYMLVSIMTSDVPFDMNNAAATLIELSKDKTAQYGKDYILYKDDNLEEKMNLVSVTTTGKYTYYSLRLSFKPIVKK